MSTYTALVQPEDQAVDDDPLMALSQQARQALAEGNPAQARKLYEQGVGLRADSADIHFGLATACFLLKDLPTAAQHFKTTTQLDPKRAGAFINLGAIYNRLDKLDDAATALRRGIQLDGKRAEGYYNLGLVCRRQGKHDLAIDAYREAARLSPRMLDAHYNLANLLLELGRHHQAVRHYHLALEINPNFEKAQRGMEEAESALRASQSTPPPEPLKSAATLPMPRRLSADELHRTLDPLEDGAYLTAMHKATIESEKTSQAFLRILEKELEPAIKDLSSTMLYPERVAELNDRLHKLEKSLLNLLNAQKDVQSGMKKLHKIGAHPPAGSPLEESRTA